MAGLLPGKGDHSPGATELFCEFFRAEARNDVVSVTSPVGEFAGRLSRRMGEGLLIEGLQVPPGLAAGHPVCVECEDGGGRVRFYAEVLAAAPAAVRTGFPFALEAPQRRRDPRIVVLGEDSFAFLTEDGRRLALADISAGGLCLIDPADEGYRDGDVLPGWVCLPRIEPIECEIAVRHIGLRHGRIYVGTEITNIRLRERLVLAEVLSTRHVGATGKAP